jgi:hypothetical protein
MVRLNGWVTALALVACMKLGCSGGGTHGLSLWVTVPSEPTFADGETPASLLISVMRDGFPLEDAAKGTVVLTTDVGQFGAIPWGAVNPMVKTVSLPLHAGRAQTSLFSSRAGVSRVRVVASVADSHEAVSTEVTVEFKRAVRVAAQIQYQQAYPPGIKTAGSGGVTSSQVTFKVLDASGSPVDDGVQVSFTLAQDPGGASFAPATAITANGTGQVQTVLSAGTVPGSVVVKATAGAHTAQSGPIPIQGNGVNFRHFSLACDSYSIGGFSYFGLNNHCTVFASDKNGQISPGTQVQLLTEAGQVPAYVQIRKDPATNQGMGTFVYQSACPFPVDVAPSSGEYSKANVRFLNFCRVINGVLSPGPETRTVNPRDGVASLVAFTTGEECYSDNNGNGQFDPGEEDLAHCDLGEPYLDENDNGRWDPPCSSSPSLCDPAIPAGEPFFDSDNNGTWTPPNGKWDAQWPIWRSVAITWTGGPDANLTHPVPLDPFKSPPLLPHGTTAQFDMQFADINGNCPTADSPGDLLSVDCGTTNCRPRSNVSQIPLQDCRSAFLDDAGLPAFHIQVDDRHTTTCTPVKDADGGALVFGDGGPANPCPPGDFSVSLQFTRTLATDISGAVGGQGSEVDFYPGVVAGQFQ